MGAACPSQILLVVGYQGSAEIRVIPQVEKVGRKAQVLPFAKLDVLDQREIPVLLKWTAIDVAAEIAESGGTEVCIRRTHGWVKLRRGGECRGIQPSVQAVGDAAMAHAASNRLARSQVCAHRRRAGSQESVATIGIQHRKR